MLPPNAKCHAGRAPFRDTWLGNPLVVALVAGTNGTGPAADLHASQTDDVDRPDESSQREDACWLDRRMCVQELYAGERA